MRTTLSDLLVATRDLVVPGDRERFYVQVRRGAFGQVTHGVYAPTEAWNAAKPEARHVATAIALAARHPRLVFASTTAALLWGRPLLGSPPPKPIAFATQAEGGRSTATIARMAPPMTPFDPARIGELLVAPLDLALADVARREPMLTALAMLDHAFGDPADPRVERRRRGETWPTSARTSAEAVAASVGVHGSRRAQQALDLADGLSGSVGETLSRGTMHLAKLGPPVLQQAFADHDGWIGDVDFWWPQYNVIGEFDGVAKYVREEFARGRSVADLVMIEKRREDRLRALGPTVVRWGWREAGDVRALGALLWRAGVR